MRHRNTQRRVTLTFGKTRYKFEALALKTLPCRIEVPLKCTHVVLQEVGDLRRSRGQNAGDPHMKTTDQTHF